jgi:hypothetical protein
VGELRLAGCGDAGTGNPWLRDGSFLVVRKVRQHVRALKTWAEKRGGDELLARMMGRDAKGTPLAPHTGDPSLNDFNYSKDEQGDACPVQSHIRRANPRVFEHERPPPRIMRRGMSFGPRYDPEEPEEPEPDRGLMFMSYQASIAEQYEVVQRWLNGGNSTGIASAQNDPLTGVGRPGDPRTFRWYDGNKVVRVPLDLDKGNRFVGLDWLLYLFAPSVATIGRIARLEPQPDPREKSLGIALIDRLRDAERMLEVRQRLAPALRPATGESGKRAPDQSLSPGAFLKVLFGAAKAFVEAYLPNASHQVIVLSTESCGAVVIDPRHPTLIGGALGVDAVLRILEQDGEAGRFRTFQRQPAHRGRPIEAHLHGFLGIKSGRKIRYGRLLVEALDLDRVPAPLDAVLAEV